MLYLFDQDDKFITILTEETGLVDMWFKDYQNHLIDEPFVFKISSESPKLKYIEADNQVAFTDRDGNLRLMRMKQLYEESSQEESLIRVVCEPSFLELYDHFIEDKRYVSRTAQNALDGVLQGSRYVGEVTVELGLATDNFYWIDGIEAVFKILETWGGALKDTITLDDENEIIERKIWIVQRLGADNGLIVEPDFNAESIERKTLSYVETALWGQGSSLEITDDEDEHTGGYTRYITFEDVVWSKSKGDPVDKPKGQKWVGDPQALNEYGYLHNGIRKHRYGHFSNQDYETPEELLMATWLELQERKLKEIMHEATISAGDKTVSLGDTVTILDRNYNKPIELQSQITALEYNPLHPKDEVTIIIGKYIDMNEDPLRKDVDDLKSEVGKPRPTKPITDESFPDIKPGIPTNLIAVGGFQVIQLDWDYNNAVYISHYEVYGSQVADFVPDSQHLLWRGRVSAFAHTVDTDQKWYYYLRAVNTRGTPSGFSVRVEASSRRVISDDILFGSIIADHFKDGLDIAAKLAQNSIDFINRGPMERIQYTQDELDVTRTELENRLSGVDGTIFNINQEVDELIGFKSTTITRLSNVDSVLSAHDTAIAQNATNISLKASQTSVDNLTGRMSNAESTINVMSAEIDLKVNVDGVIHGINISDEMVLIHGNKIHITGQTEIDDAVIGTAAIANLSVTSAKIARLAIGTAQMQDAAITNAKIANATIDDAKIASLSVVKLRAGTINADLISIANNKVNLNHNGVYVYAGNMVGASLVEGNMTFNDHSNGARIGLFAATVWSDGVTKGISMNMEANRYVSFGHYTGASTGYTPMVVMNPGTAMAGVPRGLVSNLPYRANDDIWLGPNALRFGLNNNHNHASIYKSSGEDLIVASYQSVGLAHITSGGVANTKLSIHPNEVKINVDTTFHGLNIRSYADLWMGAKTLRFGDNPNHNQATIHMSSGRDLLLGSYQEIGFAHIRSGGVYSTKMSIDSNTIHMWQDVDMHGWKLLRVGDIQNVSFDYLKQDIERWQGSALEKINASTIHQFRMISDVESGVYRIKYGLVIGEGYNTPVEVVGEGGIDLYAMISWGWKATQEIDTKVVRIEDRLDEKDMQIQLLQQKIKQLEENAA